MKFYSERLILRAWTFEDAQDLYKYAKDKEIAYPCGWLPHKNVEDSIEVIKTLFLPDTYTFAICLKKDNKAIGSIGIILSDKSRLAKKENEAELGCWIGKDFWGQGLMIEAMTLLINFSFEKLDIETIYCGYTDGNIKSKRLQEKLGFKYFSTDEAREYKALKEFRRAHTNILTKIDWLEFKKNK